MDLTGEYSDRDFVTTRGDTRITITIGRNENTVALGRVDRFLVDDPKSSCLLAYELTKPFKMGYSFGEQNGVYKFVLQEVVSTEFDNMELRIADYYRHFPKEPDGPKGQMPTNPFPPPETKEGKKVWI